MPQISFFYGIVILMNFADYAPVFDMRAACRTFYRLFYGLYRLVIRNGAGYFGYNVVAPSYEHTRAYAYALSCYIVKIVKRCMAYRSARKLHRLKISPWRELTRAPDLPRYVL